MVTARNVSVLAPLELRLRMKASIHKMIDSENVPL